MSDESGVRVDPETVGPLLRGLSVLGGGGGGRFDRALDAYESLGRPSRRAVPLDALAPGAELVTAFELGAVSAETGRDWTTAPATFAERFGTPDGVVLGEAGPDLLPQALAVAERFDCALVDADVAGMRCVPRIADEVVEGTAVDRTPLVADDAVVENERSGAALESALRTDDTRFVVGYLTPARVARGAVAEGTLARAMALGRAAERGDLGSLPSVRVVAEGRVRAVERRPADGFLVAEVTVATDDGTYTATTRNEVVAVRRDGERVAAMPETVTFVDRDRRVGLSTAVLDDQRVRVVAIEEADCWAGRESLTPERVGVDI